MSIPYEQAVAEDLNLGHGSTTVTNPAGGTMSGSKIGIHSLLGENVFSATDFAAGSVTGGIQEAIDHCPADGGRVIIPPGITSINSGISITKPIVLQGHGMSGLSDSVSSFFNASVIKNLSTSADAITITRPAGNFLSGVTLEDFSIFGNKNIGGASTGSGIVFDGGSGGMRGVSLSRVNVRQAKEHGIKILNNSFMLTLTGVQCLDNGLDGINASATVGGTGQIWFYGVQCDLNDRSGIRFDTGCGGEMSIFGGSFSDSGVHGIHVNSTLMQLKCYGAHFEGNVSCGIKLDASAGHRIDGGVFLTNDTGISITGSATAVLNDAIITACEFSGNVTKDIVVGASAKNVVIGIQSENTVTVTDNGTNTQYHDPSIHKFGTQAQIINAVEPYLGLTDTSAVGTPNKYIQSKGGALQVINSAFTQAILQLQDGGTLLVNAIGTFATQSLGTHINQVNVNGDLAGNVTITAGNTSATKAFTTAYGSNLICVVTPTGDLGAGIRWWADVTPSQLAVHMSAAIASDATFCYFTIGNPN